MIAIHARNVNHATHWLLADLLNNGREQNTRPEQVQFGKNFMELQPYSISMSNPKEMYMTLPKRQNFLAATIAETFWVMAGRDDISFLNLWLPRAGEFSDDGRTWRAAYGPRLRNWPRMSPHKGVTHLDQIEVTKELLQRDINTRQAVIAIYDPGRDTGIISKDIPCNDFIQFLHRNGKLSIRVVVRSNDAIWGFSGINAFEWSFLQQTMASALGVEAGDYHHIVIGSMHLYSNMYDRAAEIVAVPYEEQGDNHNWQQLEYHPQEYYQDVCAYLESVYQGFKPTWPANLPLTPVGCLGEICLAKALVDKGDYVSLKAQLYKLEIEKNKDPLRNGKPDGHVNMAYNYVLKRMRAAQTIHGKAIGQEVTNG